MTLPKHLDKVLAAVAVLLAALTSFFKSSDWQTALLVTGGIAMLVWQTLELRACQAHHRAALEEIHSRDKILAVLWFASHSPTRKGRRTVDKMGSLEQVVGPKVAAAVRDAAAMVSLSPNEL